MDSGLWTFFSKTTWRTSSGWRTLMSRTSRSLTSEEPISQGEDSQEHCALQSYCASQIYPKASFKDREHISRAVWAPFLASSIYGWMKSWIQWKQLPFSSFLITLFSCFTFKKPDSSVKYHWFHQAFTGKTVAFQTHLTFDNFLDRPT